MTRELQSLSGSYIHYYLYILDKENDYIHSRELKPDCTALHPRRRPFSRLRSSDLRFIKRRNAPGQYRKINLLARKYSVWSSNRHFLTPKLHRNLLDQCQLVKGRVLISHTLNRTRTKTSNEMREAYNTHGKDKKWRTFLEDFKTIRDHLENLHIGQQVY